MKLNRIMIASPGSGSGKTTVTCALLQVLKEEGRKITACKCGPDYIDPLFHRKVIGIPSRNLDTFFTGEEETGKLFLNGRTEGEFVVLEGAMGLFDGLGGVREEGSSYHLAKVTGTPIILVVDAKGMGQSLIPLLAGFLAYDREKLIRGVILNRMSQAYYGTIRPLIEAELPVPVLGYFPEEKQLRIESRHLGLTLPHETADIRERLRAAAERFRATVSVEEIVKTAEAADGLEGEKTDREPGSGREKTAACGGPGYPCKDKLPQPVIAVASDEAFCFYYEDNLRLLQACGAAIAYFSPLRDKKLPEGCSGLLIGGGYPELYAERLSVNREMLSAVRRAAESGMPMVAECGGFMYLHDVMEDPEGKPYAMAGVVPGRCRYTGKLVRFGYVELEERQKRFLPEGERIRGHEFHYYDSTYNGEGCTAVKPVSGKSYPCIVADENRWLGFPHLYYPSNPAFCTSFVEKAAKYRAEKEIRENSHRFFENRDCRYFPCHSGLEAFNCLFCYCPMYHKKDCPGNPRFMERGGKTLKICTDCTFPHRPDNYDTVVKILKNDISCLDNGSGDGVY